MEDNSGKDFPLYKMNIDGKEYWLPLSQAGVEFDNGWVPVNIGGLVLEGPGVTREITDTERTQIADIADDYSASK